MTDGATIALEVAKIIGGGVVASGLTLAINGWWRNQELTRAGSSLAARLIPVLELYARACAAIRGTHQNDMYEQGYDPYDYSWVASLPEAPSLPVDDHGWRALEPKLAARAQSFHLLIHTGVAMIRGVAEDGDADDVSLEVEQQAVSVGMEAYRLMRDLSLEYDLPMPAMPWNYVAHFEEEQQRFRNVLEAQRRSLRDLNAAAGLDN